MGEIKIKPIEPVEPFDPLEPMGGPMSLEGETDAVADDTVSEMTGVQLSEDEVLTKENGSTGVPGKKKRKRVKIYDITAENDIKYRGFLSYRHLRILGWIAMAMTVINIFLAAGMKISPQVSEKYDGLHEFLGFFAEFGIFLFLFANFAVIIDKKSSYKSLFILYGTVSAGFVGLFAIVYYRYLYNSVSSIASITGKKVASNDILGGSFISFNVFLDLLLCTAVVFFIDYRPKKWFVGKKLYIFRAFTAIPILYELVCILLKYYSAAEGYRLHPMVSPFLTTKPIVCFLLFLRMAFYVKGRETKFLKRGKTLEDYNAFLKTNKNSFQFAKKFALMTFIYGLVDLLFVVIMISLRLLSEGLFDDFIQLGDEEAVMISVLMQQQISQIGFGNATSLIFFAPFILLFSYTKSYRKSKVDTLIPIIAIVVIGLIILEGIFRVLWLVPDRLSSVLEVFLSGGGGV